ncbi:hypothetical protein [Succinimonas sp.]|uniref:hypothetical protein n=1 Tax=Succinimonas sp. TaxID=1936151 RepID=UPI00386D39F8
MAGKGVMLAAVGGAVLVTAGVAAYPAMVWLGNKMYDQNVENFTKGSPVVYNETEKNFSSRTGTWKLDTPLGELVFKSETKFGMTGAETLIVPDYESAGFKAIFKELSVKEYPKAEMHMGYSITKQSFTSDGFVEPFKISNEQVSCDFAGVKFESAVAQNVNVNATGAEVVKSFRSNSGKSSGNVSVPGVSCVGTSDGVSVKLENLTFKIESVESYPSMYDFRVASFQLSDDKNKKIAVKNLTFGQTAEAGSGVFNFKSALYADELVFPNDMTGGSVELGRTGMDVRMVEVKDADFASIVDFYRDMALGEFADSTSDADIMASPIAQVPMDIRIQELTSKSANGGSFDAKGSAQFVIKDIMNGRAAIDLNFTKSYADAVGAGDIADSGVAMGFLKKDGDKYGSSVSFENHHLSVNGKPLF